MKTESQLLYVLGGCRSDLDWDGSAETGTEGATRKVVIRGETGSTDNRKIQR